MGDVRFEHSRTDQVCPRCGVPLVRVKRRLIDRLVSLVSAVRRYQCQEIDCRWRGSLRMSEGKLDGER